MKNELKIEIADALNKYLETFHMSQNKFADQIGINSSYISVIHNKEFKLAESPIADRVFEIIASKIDFKLEKNYWEPVTTDQMKRIIATLSDAKEFGLTNVITGETGCGKTYVANRFARQNPLDTFIVTVSQQDTISDLIEKVGDVLKVPTANSRSKRLTEITKHLSKLKYNGNKPMLIFDESEYMKAASLCAMKELYDNLNGICAVIMIGTDQLVRNIEKLKKKNTDGIPQLFRRIKYTIRILPTIDKTFKEFLSDIEDKDLKLFLRRNCDNYGELHDLLVPAKRESERLGEPLTENLIRKIINMPLV